jgi:hypothetical protein
VAFDGVQVLHGIDLESAAAKRSALSASPDAASR